MRAEAPALRRFSLRPHHPRRINRNGDIGELRCSLQILSRIENKDRGCAAHCQSKTELPQQRESEEAETNNSWSALQWRADTVKMESVVNKDASSPRTDTGHVRPQQRTKYGMNDHEEKYGPARLRDKIQGQDSAMSVLRHDADRVGVRRS